MAFLAAGMVLLSGATWAVALVADPDPFDPGAAALLAVSVVIVAATASLGMVLAHGRWARILGLGVLAGEAVLAAVMGLSWWIGPALLATVAGVFLLAGPWLDSFLRRLPPADPPARTAVGLALGLLFVPAAVAVSAPGGIGAFQWAAGLTAVLTAWAYSRALSVGLWSARVVVPALLVAAAFASPPWGTVGLMAVAGAVLGLAWMPSTSRAANPLVPSAAGVAVPPELVPSDLLAQAGYDERGRPIKRPRP